MSILFCSAVCVLFLGGLVSLFLKSSPKTALTAGALAGFMSSCGISVACMHVFLSAKPLVFSCFWLLPFEAFSISIDLLSALFLLLIVWIGFFASLYSIQYLKPYYAAKQTGKAAFYLNSLIAGMVLVCVSNHVLLFLFSWEIMTLTSFFLVTMDTQSVKATKAGLIYLLASQIGTAFLLVYFIVLSSVTGTFQLDQIAAKSWLLKDFASLLFILALIGFGTKAGFIPMHIWLPEAHPEAPSHVSAVMSGVMIKMGIYGILRNLSILGAVLQWWGCVLIAIGVLSGILGILSAMVQHDFKKLLAYCSIENIGVIALGLGMGVLGITSQSGLAALLGFTGALLHTINHAVYKPLLFFGAGSIHHATGSRDIGIHGGLQKKMPATGITFLTGSAAICGLPPLNGFVSEFLIYLAAFFGLHSNPLVMVCSLSVILALSVIGGLASACFTKLYGILFLGHARSPEAENAHEAPISMLIAPCLLTLGCICLSLCSPMLLPFLAAIIKVLFAIPDYEKTVGLIKSILFYLSWINLGLVTAIAAVYGITCRFKRNKAAAVPTWDCGYLKPTAKMQYTAASFLRVLQGFFHFFLRTKEQQEPVKNYFPSVSAVKTETSDWFKEKLYQPFMKSIQVQINKLKFFQHGKLHLYILTMTLTLVILLIFFRK